MAEKDPHKGGYSKSDWMALYVRDMSALGFMIYAAEGMAIAAWEDADDDVTPREAVDAELEEMRRNHEEDASSPL